MDEVIRMLGWFSLSFAGSAIIAYGFATSQRRLAPVPRIPTSVRIRARHGMYRAFLEAIDRSGWLISAPLQRDMYVPLQPGEEIIVEAPTSSGVLLFRTVVSDRCPDARHIRLETPRRSRHLDRREEPRNERVAGRCVQIDGHIAELVNLSLGGACALVKGEVTRGTRVRFWCPSSKNDRYGWVLDSTADVLDGGPARRVRIRFE